MKQKAGINYKAGINPSVVSRLERGLQIDLRASVLVGLTTALEISVDALLPHTLHAPSANETLQLAAILAVIEQLPLPYQRQIAALLYGYLSALPTQEFGGDDATEGASTSNS